MRLSQELKSILFYVALISGVVLVTMTYTAPGDDLIDYTELPTTTPPLPTFPPPTPTPAIEEVCAPTSKANAYGYRPGAPITTTLSSPDTDLPLLIISGTVYADDCATPLPGAIIEIWHADDTGRYDISDAYLLRGRFQTDLVGRYQFTTTMPGRYTVGIEPLPAHVHYRVSYGDAPPLTTQLIFRGDPFIHRFPYIRPDMITNIYRRPTSAGPVFRGKFDIVLPVRVQDRYPTPRR